MKALGTFGKLTFQLHKLTNNTTDLYSFDGQLITRPDSDKEKQ